MQLLLRGFLTLSNRMVPYRSYHQWALTKFRWDGRVLTINIRVVDRATTLDACIAELRSMRERLVMGVDIKCTPWCLGAAVLFLCVGYRCLIIQLHHLDYVPQSLKDFLADEKICFVGVGISEKIKKLQSPYELECNGIEVGDLAARVFKKPSLSGCGLAELAREAGVVSNRSLAHPDYHWGAGVFSHEAIKYAIHDVCTISEIGDKLFN